MQAQIMNLINQIGIRNLIIIGIILLVLIILLLIYRSLRLKVCRQEIVEIENHVNGIKTLPIQYRLGRVKSIARNMSEVAKDYESFAKDFEDLQDFQKNKLDVLVNEVDEQLFYGKLRGAQKKLSTLKELSNKYEKDAKSLLARIEKVTEIENKQRIEIIRVKEKYRQVAHQYDSVRLKIEKFVPQINEIFKGLDEDFVTLEGYMNDQLFNEAKSFTIEIEEKIDRLSQNMQDLPPYINVVNHLLPEKIKALEEIIQDLNEDYFALEEMHALDRHDEIVSKLHQAIELVKSVKIKEAGDLLKGLTDDIENLAIELTTEQESYKGFRTAYDACIKIYDALNDKYNKAIESYSQLKEYYILSEEVTIDQDYHVFKGLYNQYRELEDTIKSNKFSYNDINQTIDELMQKSPEHEEKLDRFEKQKEVYYKTESDAIDELENINIVLLETKSEIKNNHLPMINDSYKDYIKDSYEKAAEIQEYRGQRPIQLETLKAKVEGARDVIYKLYDNVHNLVVTAQMVEEAILFGNRYRSSLIEVNTELTKAEVLFRNGEYTDALSIAIDVIEKIEPGCYEKLIKKQEANA